MEHNVANDGVPGITQCPNPSPIWDLSSEVKALFLQVAHSHTVSELPATAQPGTTPTSPSNTRKVSLVHL